MEPRANTSNASEVPKPLAYTPPPRLKMSMTKLPDGTCRYVPVVPTAVSAQGDRNRPVMVSRGKRQGRPRKYQRFTATFTVENPTVSSMQIPSPVSDADSTGTMMPLATINALGFRLDCFTPYTIDITAGQDINSTISLFCQFGRTSVLSANGVVSQVVLHKEASSGGIITYEGRFQILLLAGLLSEAGGLRVLLAGPDCQVFGGCLAGTMIAAAPVQVIVGSFGADGYYDSRQLFQHVHGALNRRRKMKKEPSL